MRLPLMLATVATTVGLALAVPALADPGDPPPGPVPDDPAADAHFLDTLNQAGMTYRSGPDAVAAGRMACNMMISGRSEKDVVDELSMRNPGLNGGGAMKFAALASSTYCPDYLSKSSVHTTQPLIPGLGGQPNH
ncbi:MAG: DUF732 domain-containing protein [Mycobacterium sp.]|uniref:DUF732 domain-containing protein n=1 Tax=Mycobacterium sp. TaxID=1785 RepID=UPI003C6B0C32